MTVTDQSPPVENGAVQHRPTLAEQGVFSTHRDVGQWALWCQNHPGSSGYGATVTITAHVLTDGCLSGSELQLPVRAAWVLADLLHELMDNIAVAEAAAEMVKQGSWADLQTETEAIDGDQVL